MYYDKRIRYLSYFESDIKLQNAGYVKFQVRDSLCHTLIYVKGPRLMGSGEARVYLLSEKQGEKAADSFYAGSRKNNLEKHIVGTLSIRNGQGHCAVRFNAEDMGGSGLRYDEICGIKIELHEYQYLESQWTVVNFMPERRKTQTEEMAGYRLRQTQSDVCVGGSGMRNEERGAEGGKRNSERSEEPVEINLIVTPVSENLRVEKVVKEEAIPEIEVVDILPTNAKENAEFSGYGDAEYLPDNRAVTAGDAKEIVVKEMRDAAEEKNEREIPTGGGEREIENTESDESGSYIEILPDDEDSMQKALEREVLKEKTEQEETTVGRENLRGMEETESSEPEMEMPFQEQDLQSDKWEQLRMTYPIVHPIREEEEYLKIAPKDFVIFTEKYQELVHNSFLLHGYYNYKHLILGRKETDDNVIYYLGVPGTFHDREKAVAVMFGFEAFDGKREPAQNGDFGYYLRRVEI